MQFKVVCFDLDGTLIDSLSDIAECTNKILIKRGFPTHTLKDFRYFIGNGAKYLISKALPEKVRKKELINDFEEYYTARVLSGSNDKTDSVVAVHKSDCEEAHLGSYSDPNDEITMRI